jgi:hypothetical protein
VVVDAEVHNGPRIVIWRCRVEPREIGMIRRNAGQLGEVGVHL